nr:MAG TPA: hypothetical protein [Caudoviricetes sp.]
MPKASMKFNTSAYIVPSTGFCSLYFCDLRSLIYK